MTTAVLTGLGLAGAAGLNAYIPLLVVGLLVHTGHLTVPAPFDSLGLTPILAVLAVLLCVEFFADKIPGVDSVNDVIQTVVRPAAGAFLAAGSLGALTTLPPWVGVAAGIIAAGSVHGVKAASRPVINVGTAGVGGPTLSFVEDAVALAASVLAIIAPILLAILVLIGGLIGFRYLRKRMQRSAAS
ncbi:MAG: DUF4126 domain-containing protein [Actinomycetes bacterium]